MNFDALKTLGGKRKPAAGWKHRVVTIDKDLTITSPQGFVGILFDELGNAYDGCKVPGMAVQSGAVPRCVQTRRLSANGAMS